MSGSTVPPAAREGVAPVDGSGVTPTPWVRTIPWDESEGRLREAYDWQAAALGEPTEFTQLGSLAPEVVFVRLELYKAVEGVGSGLAVTERRLASYVASRGNVTPHCSSGLEVNLHELEVDPDLVARIDADPAAFLAAGPLDTGSARLDAILRYAARLTLRPGEIEPADIEELRSVGLDDVEIVDLNNLVAYYNYINRVANGLGLLTVVPAEHARNAVPA